MSKGIRHGPRLAKKGCAVLATKQERYWARRFKILNRLFMTIVLFAAGLLCFLLFSRATDYFEKF